MCTSLGVYLEIGKRCVSRKKIGGRRGRCVPQSGSVCSANCEGARCVRALTSSAVWEKNSRGAVCTVCTSLWFGVDQIKNI